MMTGDANGLSDNVQDAAREWLNEVESFSGRTSGYPIRLWRAPELVRGLLAELDGLHSWDGLMSLLDEHYPADVFPTESDTAGRDPGPRIISLIRNLAAALATIQQVRESAQTVIDMFREVESRGEQLYYAPLHHAVDDLADVLDGGA